MVELKAYGWGHFWKRKCIKMSHELHVTDFLSKQTGEWTDYIFCHALASSGGSYLNFGTLGVILPCRG
jgi:hypothetical protein